MRARAPPARPPARQLGGCGLGGARVQAAWARVAARQVHTERADLGVETIAGLHTGLYPSLYPRLFTRLCASLRACL